MPFSSRPQVASRVGGVFSSDAAEGEIALVVKDSCGKRRLRLEVAAADYDPAWVAELERWLADREAGVLRRLLRIVRQ